MKKVIKKVIKSIPNYEYLTIFRDRVKYLIQDDETFIRNRYKKIFGRDMDLDNPKTFNEKIQWRILRDRNPIYTELADKYLVREFVKEKIGEEYLIKLLGVYDSVEEIDYDKLPNQFVLKCTHDSGSVVICKDKITFDKKEANRKLKFFQKRNFYHTTREYHYKDMKPRIICEEFLNTYNKAPEDYKIYVINNNGEYKTFMQIEEDRFGDHRRGIYDENFNLLPVRRTLELPKNTVKPKGFDLMIELSKKLTEDFDFVRVDFYEIEGKVYFGEMTFTPAAGLGKFQPDEWDYKLGEMWKIKKS